MNLGIARLYLKFGKGVKIAVVRNAKKYEKKDKKEDAEGKKDKKEKKGTAADKKNGEGKDDKPEKKRKGDPPAEAAVLQKSKKSKKQRK